MERASCREQTIKATIKAVGGGCAMGGQGEPLASTPWLVLLADLGALLRRRRGGTSRS